jgi:hypothetical protein
MTPQLSVRARRLPQTLPGVEAAIIARDDRVLALEDGPVLQVAMDLTQ